AAQRRRGETGSGRRCRGRGRVVRRCRHGGGWMQLLPDARTLEREHTDEHHAQPNQEDLLLLLLCLEGIDGLPGHYGAPVADALLEGVSPVVVAVVDVVVAAVVVVVVPAGGAAAGTGVGAAA